MIDPNLFQDIYLFRDMQPDQLQKLAGASSEKDFSPGEEIFCQGDEPRAMYIIKLGSVRITQKSSGGEQIDIASLATGSHFGEMPFLDNEKRSAGVTAIEKTSLVEISYQELKNILNEDSGMALAFYRSIAHFLAGRLRVTTSDLSYSREKNIRYF